VSRFWEYESQFPDNYFSYGYRDGLVPRLRGALSGKKRVLDFGWGGGFLIPALSRVAGEVYGVDFSPTSVEVIEHLSDEQLEGTLDIIKRLLAPGGVIVFTTPNDEDLGASRLYCPECDHVFHRWQHIRSWSAESITAFLTAQGFRDVKAWTTDFSPPVGLGAWGQVRRAFRAIGNGRDTGLPHLVASGTLP
jgi:2-polyprenyl-3-methyl-5-hydroxy-6-metoxy-1,4-benzoquinol methylase